MPYNNIENIPSFWDYLAQAISQGTEGFQQGRQIRRQREQDEMRRAEAARQAEGFKTSQELARLQMDPLRLRHDIMSAEANPIPLATPDFFGSMMGGVTPIPSRPFSETQYEIAGLTSPSRRQTQRRTEAAALRGAEAGAEKSELELPVARENVTPQAVAARSFSRLGQLVDQSAESFVDKAINASGGLRSLVKPMKDAKGKTVSAEQRSKVIGETAYNDLIKNTQLGTLSPEQSGYVRARVESTLLDRQLQAYENEARLASAYRVATGSQDRIGRMQDDLRDRLTRVAVQKQALETEEKALGRLAQGARLYYDQPEDKVPENFKLAWRKLHEFDTQRLNLETEELNVKRAQARLYAGDTNISDLLMPVTGTATPTKQATPGTHNWRSIVEPSRKP